MYQYKALITRVVDGDTFDADVDVGFSIHIKHRFRLANINTPETWRPKTNAEREHGERATAFVKNLVEEQIITLDTHKLGIYGRYTAGVTLPDGRDLAVVLKQEGFEKLDNY